MYTLALKAGADRCVAVVLLSVVWEGRLLQDGVIEGRQDGYRCEGCLEILVLVKVLGLVLEALLRALQECRLEGVEPRRHVGSEGGLVKRDGLLVAPQAAR